MGRTTGLDVVHHGVDIAAAVCKRRVHKAEVRQADHPVTLARADAVFVLSVAERRLRQLDRTDRAHAVRIQLGGLVLVLARGGLARHVVHVVVNHDQVVARVAVLLDHLLVQAVEQLLVRQLAVLERQQIFLVLDAAVAAVKLQFQQVCAERAAERLFRDLEILVVFILFQFGKLLGELGHDLLAAVDVAAAQTPERAFGLFQTAAQLLHIALGDIHRFRSLACGFGIYKYTAFSMQKASGFT